MIMLLLSRARWLQVLLKGDLLIGRLIIIKKQLKLENQIKTLQWAYFRSFPMLSNAVQRSNEKDKKDNPKFKLIRCSGLFLDFDIFLDITWYSLIFFDMARRFLWAANQRRFTVALPSKHVAISWSMWPFHAKLHRSCLPHWSSTSSRWKHQFSQLYWPNTVLQTPHSRQIMHSDRSLVALRKVCIAQSR